MSWRDCTLGDVVKLQRGHDLPDRARVDGLVPIVSSSGITGRHNVSKAEPPGVVTGRYGTIGEVFYIEEPYWPLNTALYVVDFKGNSPRYVSYLLRNTLSNYRTEKAAVPGVDRNVLHLLRIRAPDRATQDRIAAQLATYDDLIANNRRRIALLQEAARLLYREWFVHLRFPGHEHVKVVDGVPEGWKKLPLGAVLNLQRGFDLPVADRIAGDIPVYGSTGVVGTHNTAKVARPTLVTGRSGSLGSVAYVDEPCWPLNTSLWVTEFKMVSAHFAYFMLEGMNLAGYGGGASVPTLDRKVVHAINVATPSQPLLELFDDQVGPIFKQQNLLGRKNVRLSQARDLLLPRLMNGDIAV